MCWLDPIHLLDEKGQGVHLSVLRRDTFSFYEELSGTCRGSLFSTIWRLESSSIVSGFRYSSINHVTISQMIQKHTLHLDQLPSSIADEQHNPFYGTPIHFQWYEYCSEYTMGQKRKTEKNS